MPIQKTKIIYKIVIYKIVILAILLNGLYGCAKTAPESATDAALIQVGAVEQAIKKECPQAKIDKDMDALRATIKSQLASCKSQNAELKAKNHTLMAIIVGILAVIIALNWAKIKSRVFNRG